MPRIQRNWLTVFDYVFILRPVLLIPPWTLLLLGYFWGSGSQFPGDRWPMGLPSNPLLLALIPYSLLLGGIYILNQVYDRDTDRANRKIFFLSQGFVSLPAALLEATLLATLSLTVSLRSGGAVRILFLISLVLGVLYCTPPIKLKGRPIADLLCNAFGYGLLAFAVGWAVADRFSSSTVIRSLPYVLAVGGVFALTTVPDIPGDRVSGDRTTGVWLGPRNTAILGAALMAASLLFSLLVRDFLCSLASLLGLPFFVLAAARGDTRACLRAEWVGGLSLVLITGAVYPWFTLLLVATFLCLRAYYHIRFGVRYPF